jgi:hypothetical protein
MTTILAIDPGNTHSGYALIDATTCLPIDVGKVDNEQLLRKLRFWLTCDHPPSHISIEMVASYGMAVGKEVFETCVWIGRFRQVVDSVAVFGTTCDLTYRREVKLHHCHTSKAKDSNISQALVDRFAPGATNHGKGTKADPGWFYGFKADIWQAYALAVYVADTL